MSDLLSLTEIFHFRASFTNAMISLCLVQVEAVSLNFKDTLLLLGVLDASAFEGGWSMDAIGVEFSGIVSEVGSEITSGVRVGDRVIASPLERQGGFQKYVEVFGHSIAKVTVSIVGVVVLVSHCSVFDDTLAFTNAVVLTVSHRMW